jgi:hypothetical protein
MPGNVGSKLGSKHGVDANYIRRYVEGNQKLLAIDRTDDIHGTRTFLVIPFSKKFSIELFIDHKDDYFDIWTLRTAHLITLKNRKNWYK